MRSSANLALCTSRKFKVNRFKSKGKDMKSKSSFFTNIGIAIGIACGVVMYDFATKGFSETDFYRAAFIGVFAFCTNQIFEYFKNKCANNLEN